MAAADFEHALWLQRTQELVPVLGIARLERDVAEAEFEVVLVAFRGPVTDTLQLIGVPQLLQVTQLAIDVEVHTRQAPFARELRTHAPEVELGLVIVVAYGKHTDA